MDKVEAQALLEAQLAGYRSRAYSELAAEVGATHAFQTSASSGTEYNVEIMILWDSPSEKVNIRVIGAVDDGRWPSGFRPMSDDFIVAPDGSFIGG